MTNKTLFASNVRVSLSTSYNLVPRLLPKTEKRREKPWERGWSSLCRLCRREFKWVMWIRNQTTGNLSTEFYLETFLQFLKFQPLSYKMYSYSYKTKSAMYSEIRTDLLFAGNILRSVERIYGCCSCWSVHHDHYHSLFSIYGQHSPKRMH